MVGLKRAITGPGQSVRQRELIRELRIPLDNTGALRGGFYKIYRTVEDISIVNAAASLAISRIAMVHRLGRMEIGETSVAVIVTAPHRKPAFDAALEGINRLKRIVPIWKKEHFADGEIWVEGEWDESVLKK